jgi:hypothetical protein
VSTSTSSDPVAQAPVDTAIGTPVDTTVDTTIGTPVDTTVDTTVDTAVVTTAPAPVQPEGFTTAVVRITEADGETCEVCVWLADRAEERSRGLMGVTDLGDAVGMVFVYASPGVRSFYMFQTPTPLSIAWFAADGGFVDSTDMAPCLVDDSSECPRYSPDEPYQLALEVFEGDLDELGLGPGARLELLAADCDSPPS